MIHTKTLNTFNTAATNISAFCHMCFKWRCLWGCVSQLTEEGHLSTDSNITLLKSHGNTLQRMNTCFHENNVINLLAVRKSHPTALGQARRKTHHRSSPVLQMWSLPLWLWWWSLSDVWHYSFWLLCTPHCWTLHVKVGDDTGELCKDEEPVCGQSSGPSHSETGQPGCREDVSTLFVLNWPKLSFWLFYITVSES